MREDTKSEENKQAKMVHEGQKCKSCDKSFSKAGHLKLHINTIHKGQKNYKCHSCSKSFSQVG